MVFCGLDGILPPICTHVMGRILLLTAAVKCYKRRHDCTKNSRLGGGRGLPASHTGMRLSKKSIDCCFELLFVEEAGRRTVVLAEARHDSVLAQPKPLSEDLRPVSCFALVAPDAFDPRTTKHGVHACAAVRVKEALQKPAAMIVV